MLILLHGNGWDEFALLGGAMLVAMLIVNFTMRRDGNASDVATDDERSRSGRDRPDEEEF
jgi:hypothetical protein